VTISVRSPDFQRALVALGYFWGARGPALESALGSLALPAALGPLLSALNDPERAARAAALGAELARLSAALDARSLGG
jgi:hypothetical protein